MVKLRHVQVLLPNDQVLSRTSTVTQWPILDTYKYCYPMIKPWHVQVLLPNDQVLTRTSTFTLWPSLHTYKYCYPMIKPWHVQLLLPNDQALTRTSTVTQWPSLDTNKYCYPIYWIQHVQGMLTNDQVLTRTRYANHTEMEWLYGNPEQGDSEALATWTSVRVSFTAPFLLFACMICFNFVIACWLYCFNVDVFVFFLYSVKSSRELMFLFILHAELK